MAAIDALIACLMAAGTGDVWQGDVDRLGSCTGADLERLIDLLNDAGVCSGGGGATPAVSPCPPSKYQRR